LKYENLKVIAGHNVRRLRVIEISDNLRFKYDHLNTGCWHILGIFKRNTALSTTFLN